MLRIKKDKKSAGTKSEQRFCQRLKRLEAIRKFSITVTMNKKLCSSKNTERAWKGWLRAQNVKSISTIPKIERPRWYTFLIYMGANSGTWTWIIQTWVAHRLWSSSPEELENLMNIWKRTRSCFCSHCKIRMMMMSEKGKERAAKNNRSVISECK